MSDIPTASKSIEDGSDKFSLNADKADVPGDVGVAKTPNNIDIMKGDRSVVGKTPTTSKCEKAGMSSEIVNGYANEPISSSEEEVLEFVDTVLEGGLSNHGESQVSAVGDIVDCVPVQSDLVSLPLPSGWMGVLHENGAFVYLHKESRVVTWSRPYAIGKATSIRRHQVPSFAIPCLNEKLRKTRLRKQKVADWQKKMSLAPGEASSSATGLSSNVKCPLNTNNVSTTNEINSVESDIEMINSGEVHNYLCGLFEFHPVEKSEWRRIVINDVSSTSKADDGIPDLLKAVPQINDTPKEGSSTWTTSVAGKTPVMLLNEYCQGVLKLLPQYNQLKSLNTSDAFSMDLTIDKISYGVGCGPSKKLAKHKAAEKALAILLPGQYSMASSFEISDEHLSLFDNMDVLDENIFKCVSKLNLATPVKILQAAIDRHHGNDKMPSSYNFERVNEEAREKGHMVYKMTCGEHSIQESYKNKSIGKQRLAQQILQLLHPHLSKWGSLMRLYSPPPSKIVLEPKWEDEFSKHGLTDKSKNEDVLDALKREMRSLSRKRCYGYDDYPKKVKRQLVDF